MERTSTRPSRTQLTAGGRTFSVALGKGACGMFEARCHKADLAVSGVSAQQALWNMQRALEFFLWSQGQSEGVQVRAW